MDKSDNLTIKYRWLIAAFILLLGAFLRLYDLDGLPYGLNQDEASAGYDAWALLNYGVDRNGCSFPALFVSWGSGQNVLMSYLSLPFIKLMGLSEVSLRLCNAIWGVITVASFGLLGKKYRGDGFALTAMAVLTICPWHIMASRWALESNLLPSMLMCMAVCCAYGENHPALIIGAGIFAGLSLYAYGTAFFFLPLFLIIGLVILWRRADKKGYIIIAAVIFVILSLPVAITQLINVTGLSEMKLLGITLPRLTESRQASTSIFSGGGIKSAEENFINAVKIALFQTDGLRYNSLGIKGGGIGFIVMLPLCFFGIILSLFTVKKCRASWVMWLWLVSAVICTFLIDGNINRLNVLWLPIIWFEAVGLYGLSKGLGKLRVLPGIIMLAMLVFFLMSYSNTFGGEGYVGYFPGLGEAVDYAESAAEDDETVYITDYVNQPYIFALFYSETSPYVFQDSVQYRNENAAFRQVLRFKGYEFQLKQEADILILPKWNTEDHEVLDTFGIFSVCR